MRGFPQGLVIGIALSVAGLVGYAYGGVSRTGHAVETATCMVRIGPGRLTGGTQCNFNTVMVGTQAGYTLCADLQVTCP